MVVRDIMEKFVGEIRVHNLYYGEDVGIINTSYKGWVKLSYTNCEVTKLELEMLNTAVLSARIVVFIDSEDAGQDSGDVEEATQKDIDDLMDSIYKDDGKEPTAEETIELITEDYYDNQPLPGDEHDFKEESESEDSQYESEDDEEEATEEDIQNLLGGIYDE